VPNSQTLNVTWWSDGGNNINWIRFVGTGGLMRIWTDQRNPPNTRVWMDIYANPLGPALVMKECYLLNQCEIHTRANQMYYIKGTVMTDPGTSAVGCTRWNVNDP
jgi:hypothetical protein